MKRARILATAATILCATGGIAAAKPFKLTMTGFPHQEEIPGDPCHIRNRPVAEGFATHLGYVTYEADEIVPNPFCLPPGTPIEADATFTLTAANGDTASGTLHVVATINYGAGTAQSVGTYTFSSGTGRFENVSGTGTWEIFFPNIVDPFAEPAQVSGDGTIDY